MEGLQRAAQHRSRSTSGWGSQARIRGVQPGQPDHLPRPRRPRKHVVQTHPTTALFRRMRSYVVGWKLVSVVVKYIHTYDIDLDRYTIQ